MFVALGGILFIGMLRADVRGGEIEVNVGVPKKLRFVKPQQLLENTQSLELQFSVREDVQDKSRPSSTLGRATQPQNLIGTMH